MTLTTLLIFLPLAAALVVWIAPLRPFWTGGIALLVALVEVWLWIVALARFDVDDCLPFEER